MSKYKSVLFLLGALLLAGTVSAGLPIPNLSPLVVVDQAANACVTRSFKQLDTLRVTIGGGLENTTDNDRKVTCSVTNAYASFGGSQIYTDMNFAITVDSLPSPMSCTFFARDPGNNNAVFGAFNFTIPADDPGTHFVGAIVDYETSTLNVWELNTYVNCTLPARDGTDTSQIYNVTTFNFSGNPPPAS